MVIVIVFPLDLQFSKSGYHLSAIKCWPRIIILNKLPVMLVLPDCKPHLEAKPWIAECSGNVFFIIPETTCICNIVGGIYSARPGKALLSAFFSVCLSLNTFNVPRIVWSILHMSSH